MKEATQKLEGQLESSVADQGSNFSAGEKQLLCLARAMLSQKKILVLDEATANIDKQCVASLPIDRSMRHECIMSSLLLAAPTNSFKTRFEASFMTSLC